MVKTKIHKGSNGQYKVTVPQGIGDAMNLDRASVEWTVVSGDKLEVKVVERAGDDE